MKIETFYSCEVCHRSFTDLDTCREHEEICKRLNNERGLWLRVVLRDGRVHFFTEIASPLVINDFIRYYMKPQLSSGVSHSVGVSIACFKTEKAVAKNKLFEYLSQVFKTTLRLVETLAENSEEIVVSSVDIPYLAEQVYEDYKSNSNKK
jgi:hypothetical protein